MYDFFYLKIFFYFINFSLSLTLSINIFFIPKLRLSPSIKYITRLIKVNYEKRVVVIDFFV